MDTTKLMKRLQKEQKSFKKSGKVDTFWKIINTIKWIIEIRLEDLKDIYIDIDAVCDAIDTITEDSDVYKDNNGDLKVVVCHLGEKDIDDIVEYCRENYELIGDLFEQINKYIGQ